MQKYIKLNNKNIEYTLKVNKRSKGFRLSVRQGGECLLTVPRFVPQFIINQFLKNRSGWIEEKLANSLRLNNGAFKSKKEKNTEYLKYKVEALSLVLDRLDYFNRIYNFEWKNIAIKNQKTRWGSCSSKGNLNFNYKIVLLPAKSTDYIIIHELCHLRELNHSREFWSLVSQAMPDYKIVRKSLHTGGLILN